MYVGTCLDLGPKDLFFKCREQFSERSAHLLSNTSKKGVPCSNVFPFSIIAKIREGKVGSCFWETACLVLFAEPRARAFSTIHTVFVFAESFMFYRLSGSLVGRTTGAVLDDECHEDGVDALRAPYLGDLGRHGVDVIRKLWWPGSMALVSFSLSTAIRDLLLRCAC